MFDRGAAVTTQDNGPVVEPDDRAFRPDVEGLRAVAVLVVVLFHAGVSSLSGGYIGVDVFFVISGFVITGLLLRETQETGRASILGFYARRCRRILPMATLVILASVLCSYLLLGVVAGNATGDDGRWAAVFLSNFHFASLNTNYFSASLPPSPLQNYWTLSVEEQFYVVYPTLFLLIVVVAKHPSFRSRIAAVLTGIVAVSYWFSITQTAAHPTAAYFSPFTRAWELALGALVAVGGPWLKQIPVRIAAGLTWVGLAGIAVGATTLTPASEYPGSLAAIPVVGAALLIAGGTPSPTRGVEMILAWAPFRWLGKRSYSLYLWHWPILVLAAERVGKRSLSLGTNLVLVAAAVVVSMASFRLVENPIRRWRLPSRRSVAVGLGLVLFTVALLSGVIALHSTGVSHAPVPAAKEERDVLVAVAAATHVRSVTPSIQPPLSEAPTDSFLKAPKSEPPLCEAYISESTQPICVVGDRRAKRLVVLYGDSHATMWLPALTPFAATHHWRLVVLSKIFCPPESVTVNNPPGWQRPGKPYTVCDAWHRWVLRWINETKPQVLIVTQQNVPGDYQAPSIDGATPKPFTPDQWQSGLETLLNAVTVPNIQKVVLANIPSMPQYIPECLSSHLKDVQACSAPASKAVSPFNAVEKVAAQATGSRFVDPTPWFCSATCVPIIGKYIVYWDYSHVTETYARHLRLVLAHALGLTSP